MDVLYNRFHVELERRRGCLVERIQRSIVFLQNAIVTKDCSSYGRKEWNPKQQRGAEVYQKINP